MAFTSTVPGAVRALLAHFEAVAATHPSLSAGSYFGPPIETVAANYMAIGEWPSWQVLLGYKQDFRGLPATAVRKNEDYTLPCHIRAWAATSTATARLTDAFTLFDGVLGRLQTDLKAGGAISSSGTWQVNAAEIAETGPLGGSGYGVVLTFDVHVFNVTVPSY